MKMFIYLSLLFLVSCGGGSGGVIPTNTRTIFQPAPELLEYTVTGTSLPVDNIIQLNSSVSNYFSVFVKMRTIDAGTKHKGFEVNLFLSLDRKFDASDIEIFSRHCAGDHCDGVNSLPIKCSLFPLAPVRGVMHFDCKSPNGSSDGLADFDENFFDTLPKRAFLLLQLTGTNYHSDYKIYAREVEIN